MIIFDCRLICNHNNYKDPVRLSKNAHDTVCIATNCILIRMKMAINWALGAGGACLVPTGA